MFPSSLLPCPDMVKISFERGRVLCSFHAAIGGVMESYLPCIITTGIFIFLAFFRRCPFWMKKSFFA